MIILSRRNETSRVEFKSDGVQRLGYFLNRHLKRIILNPLDYGKRTSRVQRIGSKGGHP